MSYPIVASQTTTATNAGTTAVELLNRYQVMQFMLDLTAAATDAIDTLDVFVQTRMNGNWFDIVHFTQVLGNGGAKRFVSKVVASEPQTMYEIATALAAGSIRNVLGDAFRARWAIVDANANASFTFAVLADGKWDLLARR